MSCACSLVETCAKTQRSWSHGAAVQPVTGTRGRWSGSRRHRGCRRWPPSRGRSGAQRPLRPQALRAWPQRRKVALGLESLDFPEDLPPHDRRGREAVGGAVPLSPRSSRRPRRLLQPCDCDLEALRACGTPTDMAECRLWPFSEFHAVVEVLPQPRRKADWPSCRELHAQHVVEGSRGTAGFGVINSTCAS